jgi:UDP-glucose 4-epimerase
MKVFVTGSRGLIGAEVARGLAGLGMEWRGFDLADGQDILDRKSLVEAMEGCDAVLHSAALLGHADQDQDEVFKVNVVGTQNVVSGVRQLGIRRLVYLSSVNVLGVFKGERAPDYLPIDDDHPLYPKSAYGVAKYLAEEICRLACIESDLSCVALRPPGVWPADRYGRVRSWLSGNTETPGQAMWEYGAFIDVRDLASACITALIQPFKGFHAMLVAANDVVTSRPDSRALANLMCPDVRWRGGAVYDIDQNRSLVDCRLARSFIGFDPQYTWQKQGVLKQAGR